MNGAGRNKSPWKKLRQRLGFKAIGISGVSSWGSDMPLREEKEEEHHDFYENDDQSTLQQSPAPPCGVRISGSQRMNQEMALEAEHRPALTCAVQIPVARRMNLETAFAAEWESRNQSPPAETALKSLMKLFEEADGEDKDENENGNGRGGLDSKCCVCMDRDKGAAFIPCGHTYCRVCSREVLLNRGSCPLCNKSIMDILYIF